MPLSLDPGRNNNLEFLKALWANLKSAFGTIAKFLVQYPLAIVATVVVVVVGLALIQAGVKDVNIGGIVKWLFSRPGAKHDVIAASNTVPTHRVDDQGNKIPVGTPDANGWTQWEVQPYKAPSSPLRDKTVVSVTSPSTGNQVDVQLPTGVKDTDVEQVVEVKPEVFVVKTNNESKVHAKDLLDRLPKPKDAT